jgi:hypothetical protein
MKSIFLIITLLVVSLSSFTTYKSFVASISLIQTTDSIKAMNKQIIEFVKTKIKKKIGTGECWDLAAEALKIVNAKWDMKYKFGKEIDFKKEPIYPGDIIQFENVILNYEKDGKKFTEKMSHHTAIIFEVIDKTNFTMAHQNNGYSGKKVGISPIDLATLTKGKFKIYRAEK